jgi:hypothetical protein
MTNNKRKLMAWKMKRLDKNDSDVLKKFTRKNQDSGRPMFSFPEGRYKKVGDRYIKQADKHESVIHE